MYLLGDFGVLVNGSDVTLTEQPETIAFITLSSQEFGFYGANYQISVAVDCPNGRLRGLKQIDIVGQCLKYM
ncbi:MAG: hypothetical protein ACLTER_23435 [Ruminococcus sp.]